MKYFFSFSKMDADFARRCTIDAPETSDEIDERLRLLFDNSAFLHRVSGLWPKDDQFLGRYRATKTRASVASTVWIVLMQFSLVARIRKDELAEFMMETALAIAAAIKVLPCIINRRQMIKLHRSTRELNLQARESSAEKRIAYWWLGLQNKLVSFVVASYASVLCMYLLVPLLNGEIFPFPGLMPSVFRELPWIVPIYLIDLVMISLRLIIVLSCDCHSIVFVCQLLCELQLVQRAIERLNYRDRRRAIGLVVERHEKVLKYGRTMCDNYSVAFVAQHCALSAVACIAALSLLYMKNKALLYKFLAGLAIAVAQMLLLCFVGDKIATESLKIGDCLGRAYVEFLDDATSLKAILAMLVRAQRPLLLRVGEKFIVDLNLYRMTMGNISSIFLLLKKFIDE